jgi:hypothetical protein
VWELICHHEYCWGTIAADRSPWHSDGIPSSVSPLPGGNIGLHFSGPQSQIAIPRRPNDPWGYISALNLEILMRFTQVGGTVIDADQSFRIRSNSQGKLLAEFPSETIEMGDIPLGAWLQFNFNYNGFDLFGWGFGTYPLPGGGSGVAAGGGQLYGKPVPGVGPKGILIGNRLGAPAEHFTGDIALIKIWRDDPKSMPWGFVDRPLDPGIAKCWTDFIRKYKEVLKQHPECIEWFDATMGQLTGDFFAALLQLAQKDSDKIDEYRQMCMDYRDLWRAGKLGSPEMQALLVKLRDWLEAEGLVSLNDPKFQAIYDNPCMKNMLAQLPRLDCDPEAKAAIGAILGVPS